MFGAGIFEVVSGLDGSAMGKCLPLAGMACWRYAGRGALVTLWRRTMRPMQYALETLVGSGSNRS